MVREITSGSSLSNLKKEAKRWLKDLRADDATARARFDRAYPSGPARPGLRDVQHALAREYSHPNWVALTTAVERPVHRTASLARATAHEYQQLADDVMLAFNAKDETALQRVNAFYQRSFSSEDLWAEIWRRVYSFRQRAFSDASQQLRVDEAQTLIAQDAGFSSWATMLRGAATGAPPVAPYQIDPLDNAIRPRRTLDAKEWDELIAVMRERKITSLHADGQMSDAVMARVADLDHVTALSLGGSRQLTDDGLLSLGRMQQIERLDLSEYPGGRLTDRALEVLRELPNLRVFEMTWQRGITDSGAANLRFCDQLESVGLMGSPTGDGVIAALQGKPRLRRFSTGRLVTDNGLPLLHNFPLMKNAGVSPVDIQHITTGGQLLIDGPFSDDGLAGLAGLHGVVDLDLFWHVSGLTPAAFKHLVGLPNLMALGADEHLSGDVALMHIGALPKLRKLRIQKSVATDEGFEALSRSTTLEYLWGRECPHFENRGFTALSKMPSLRGLGIGCHNVDDATLALLPTFPVLRELTPVGVQDPGFRHIGQCERLERLTCMYCRDTTDAATEHIARLALRYYYAGLTRITDRSLEILGTMASCEQIELYECPYVTDAGLVFIAKLPELREVHLDSLPGVTFEGTRVFPPHVRVKYST